MNKSLGPVAIAACAIGLLAACDKKVEIVKPVVKVGQDDAPAVVNTYHVRGIIASLPEPGKPASELQIQHEAINDFVDASGVVAGMNAMTMPFPNLAPGVTLDGLVVGDKIAFAFTNTWSGPPNARKPGWVVDSIAKLPADTELVFGKKSTPPASPPASTAEPAGGPADGPK